MNFEDLHEIIPFLAIGTLIVLIPIQLYFKYASPGQLKEMLTNFYANKGIRVIDVAKLSISEKMKYGVSFSPFTVANNMGLSMFSSVGESYFLKVDTETEDHAEQIRYVEMYVRKRELISCEEFDIYQF
jgi:hypothetical protein